MESLNDSQFVAVSLLVAYVGGFVLIALAAARKTAFLLGAILGIVATFITVSAFEPDAHLGRIFVLALVGGAIGIGMILLCYGAFLLVTKMWADFIANVRQALKPQFWQPDAPPPSPRDIARRWFVVVGAVTGAVVFSLATTPEFLEGLKSTFSPAMIFAVAVAAFASSVLEGPLHEFVMGHQVEEDPASKMPFFSFESMTLRSWLRLGLLGCFFLALALLFNSLEESVSAASGDAATMIIAVGYTPAVASYYWASALQLGLRKPELLRKSGYSSWVAGNVLFYPWGALVTFTFGLLLFAPQLQYGGTPDGKALLGLFVIAPFAGLIPTMFLSGMTIALPAIAGAWVIERVSGWKAMAALFLAQTLANFVPAGIVMLMMAMIGAEQDPFLLPYLAFGAAGWVFGLVASGFPQLVMKHAGAPVSGGIPDTGSGHSSS